MKEFLQEWGTTILTGVAVLALIAIIVLLKPTMQKAFNNVFDKFTTQIDSAVDAPSETSTEN